MTKDLVNDLSAARIDLIEVINKIPSDGRGQILIGKWSLKDLMAHLTGWADYQIVVLKAMRIGEYPPDYGCVDDCNERSTGLRKNWSWSKVYEEFKEKSRQLIAEYANLPEEYWSRIIWSGRKTTPEKFIKIEIKHYRITHLPQIKKLL